MQDHVTDPKDQKIKMKSNIIQFSKKGGSALTGPQRGILKKIEMGLKLPVLLIFVKEKEHFLL